MVGSFILLLITGALFLVGLRSNQENEQAKFITSLAFAGLFGFVCILCTFRFLWAGVRYFLS